MLTNEKGTDARFLGEERVSVPDFSYVVEKEELGSVDQEAATVSS